MDKHPRCGAVLQLADKKQTADCRRNVDRPQSPVGALRSCGFVEVSDQHDSASGSLCNVSQTAEDGTDFICPVHVHICAQKRLHRVNDNQPCVVLTDCPCYLGGDITSQDLAAKYKIHAPSTVRTWIKQYNNPLVFDTFDKAVATNPGATPLLHSDRGYQYTSKAFRRRILAAGMTQSMSRVARCIDNGPMEGFWGLMKRDMYYGKKYKTKEELMLAIEKYIDYYTNKRVQRNLEVLTPLEFHEQKLENVA